MLALVRRNICLYFRDRMSVFFSLLSVLIALGIYFMFLSENMISSVDSVSNVTFLMDSWFLAGSMAIVSITTTLGAYGVKIDDEVLLIRKDFMVSPMKRSKLALSYIVTSCVIGCMMCFIVLVFGEAFILLRGGELVSIIALLKILGVVILSVACGSAMMFLLTHFLHTSSSFTGASTVIGVLIGFLTGLYMPIGELPSIAQSVMKLIPTSHSASLFRQIFMEVPMEDTFNNAPIAMVDEFKEVFGLTFSINDTQVSVVMSLLFIGIVAISCYFISVVLVNRKKA